MPEPNTSVASCAFVPQEKQLRKKCNLCKNPGWQDPIQVWPHVLLSLKKSKSGKDVIYVKIPDGRTQYKCEKYKSSTIVLAVSLTICKKIQTKNAKLLQLPGHLISCKRSIFSHLDEYMPYRPEPQNSVKAIPNQKRLN